MSLLRMPDPYDFELSTRRYRAFGHDLANLLHEGGLHRVVVAERPVASGRELEVVRVGHAKEGHARNLDGGLALTEADAAGWTTARLEPPAPRGRRAAQPGGRPAAGSGPRSCRSRLRGSGCRTGDPDRRSRGGSR